MAALAVGLRHRGHEVKCFSYHPGYEFFRPALDAAGIPVIVHAKRSRIGFDVALALRGVIREWDAEAAIAFMETPSVYAEVASLGLGVRLIVSERVDPQIGVRGWSLRVRAFLHRAADAVVANSSTARNLWIKCFPRLESKFHVIPNGVDLVHFSAQPMPSTSNGPRLVSIGTVTARKNAHGLIEALVLLRARGSKVPHVTWVGKFESDRDSVAYRSLMNRRILEVGLEQSWSWAGEQQDVRSFLASAHALIHPSLREGLANVICEAMAAGRPVLASAVGDNTWLVGDAERGRTFDPEDPASIADAIDDFCRCGPDTLCNQGLAARRFAERELAFESFVSGYERLLGNGVARANGK
jgi:glycosyltransferase involved in cell wall biosynthesis